MTSSSLLMHGPFERLSSFALVNRRFAAGLTERGWRVDRSASDAEADAPHAPTYPRPDVYLFHGHPYDLVNAPGRVNAFFLSYDYARFVPTDRHLASALNARFDLLIVPSRFSAAACRRSGVRIPIRICPYGVDREEFHPHANAVTIPQRRGFCFVTAGGATERKGTDVLLRAFAREFSDRDDVTLVVKAFSYPHLQEWAEQHVDRARARRDSPHVVFDHGESASIAGYFTAADAGVFPFRAEGFGLPILECLASGRPAIVTRSGGPRDYGGTGVHWLRARNIVRDRKHQVAPDVAELRRLMRAMVERGPVDAAERTRIARAAAAWSWDRSVKTLEGLLASGWRDGRRTARRVRTTTAYVFIEKGRTSWRLQATHIDRALSRLPKMHASFRLPAMPRVASRVLIAASGAALEVFQRAGTDTTRVLHRESAPLSTIVTIVNRERQRCGLAPVPPRPMDLWRDREEAALADLIVVLSETSRSFFIGAGVAADRIRILRPGVTPARRVKPSRRSSRRLLFVASNPFRKGIRPLFDAWARVRDPRAELWCVMTPDALESPFVLRHLTADRRIQVRHFDKTAHRAYLSTLDEVDALVLPSFEEGLPYAITEGMARGLPAIVTPTAGVADVLTSDTNGIIVGTDDVTALAEAMSKVIEDPAMTRRLGDAAYETVRRMTWHEYRERWQELVAEVGRR